MRRQRRWFQQAALLLMFGSGLTAGKITTLLDTGPVGWTVSGGACPLGADCCSASSYFDNAPVYVPRDVDHILPLVMDYLPALPIWNVTPVGPDDRSQWIVPAVRGAHTSYGADLVGTVRYLGGYYLGDEMDFGMNIYAFTTTFTLTDQMDLESALIRGVWWADGTLDEVCAIQLNGLCFGHSAGLYRYYQDGGVPFEIAQGFQPGVNTLTFFVLNGFRETGLRVHMDSSILAIPEPGTWALMGAGFAGLWGWRRRGAKSG